MTKATFGAVPSHLDRAWAAGFFDGEGCAISPSRIVPGCLGPRKTRAIAASVLQLAGGEKIIKRFQAAVGGLGRVGQIGQYGKSNGKPWRWMASSFSEFMTVAGVLWPYLSDIKKKAFKKSIVDYTNFHQNRVKLPRGAAARKAAKALKAEEIN